MKSTILSNRQFKLDKTIGQWQFLSFNDEYKPLFYSPQTLTYILIDSYHFKYMLDIPQLPNFKDALLFSEIKYPVDVPKDIMDNFISQSIVEGVCLNCSFQEDIIDAKLPKILPSSKLYFIVKFFEDRKLESIDNPSEKIDFVLGTMAKNSAALQLLVRDSKNREVSINILEDWNQKLRQIEEYYLSISDPDTKLNNSYKIHRYLWFLIVGSQEWRSLSDNTGVVTKLIQFEDKARQLIVDLKLEPAPLKKVEDVKQYQVDIPKDGDYRINIYSPKGFSIENQKTQNIILLDQKQQIELFQVKDASNWYQSKEVHLTARDYKINFTSSNIEEISLPGLTVDAKEATIECKNADLGIIDPTIRYEIEFEYKDITDRPLRLDLYERSNQFIEDEIREVGESTQKKSFNPNIYKTSFVYMPSEYVESAYIKFCLDGNYTSPSSSEVGVIKIKKLYTPPIVLVNSIDLPQDKITSSPQIEFVALNQTKYLVKVKNAPSEYILNFNSRFDQEWKLREVDANLANKYFTGDTYQYLNGEVIEYARKDQHLITDYLFLQKSQKLVPTMSLNLVGNGWILGDNQQGKDKVYLVEYDHQNLLYKTILVSLLTFLILTSIFVFTKIYEKSH